MDNAGTFDLAVLQINAAKSLSLLTATVDLAGMSSVSLEANFQYGSGGSACSAIIATTFDDGATWRHIARFDFGTATAVKEANIQANAAKGITAYVDLGSEGVNDGMLGDQLAVLLLSSGTYVNTTLSVRASVR